MVVSLVSWWALVLTLDSPCGENYHSMSDRRSPTTKQHAGQHRPAHGRKRPLPDEAGAVFKDWGGRIPVALTMPNTYYVGMSSLALHLLYRTFNAEDDVVCERIFWEKGAAQAGKPRSRWKAARPAADFAVWAFTISWEMDYFNVVELLRQAGIPPLAADRQASTPWDGRPWPLLIAGGPGVTMNPEPVAPFFDAILIGEGEEAVPQLHRTLPRRRSTSSRRLLRTLDAHAGLVCAGLRPSNRNHPHFRRWSGCGCATCPTSTPAARSTRPTPSSPTCT